MLNKLTKNSEQCQFYLNECQFHKIIFISIVYTFDLSCLKNLTSTILLQKFLYQLYMCQNFGTMSISFE